MRKQVHDKVVFKPYHQNQPYLLPPSVDELIPSNHLVRVVNQAVDRMNIDHLLQDYEGGGASSYHPKMMLKVLIYAYIERIYSSRRIAKAIRENVHFMWLAGGNRPDFRTINRFRSSRLKGTIEEVFMAVVELLLGAGLIDFRDYFLDGTKIESTANKYSFVWGRATRTFETRLQSQLKELLHQIDDCNESENRRYGDRDLEELGESGHISSEKLESKLRELEERLSRHPDDKELRKGVKKIRDDYLPRQQKYDDQKAKLGDRNSYSKTDVDATFMRMKEDHMLNGQLKPGYNVQMGTENQFIIDYSIYQHPGDSPLMIPHLEDLRQKYGRLPENVIADSGYGSEENYHYLETEGITGYVKYNNFHYEQTKKFKQQIFRVENLIYEEETDSYVCPAGKRLKYIKTEEYITGNGYVTSRRVYQCESCKGCEHRLLCHKAKGDRIIKVGPELKRYHKRARELLESPEGKRFRSRRPVEVEAVFGQIKSNRGFRRFMLRGLEKVKVEFGLVAIAHNLMKMWSEMQKYIGFSWSCLKNMLYRTLFMLFPKIQWEFRR